MAESQPLTQLAASLGMLDGGHHHVAFVGGGGKTTLAFALAGQLPGGTVVTSTTKMGADQHRGLPVLLSPSDEEIRTAIGDSTVVVWDRVVGTKAVGVDRASCDRWFGVADHVVVEADGSRRLPFKAPGVDEPVVPATATLVVSVIGAEALGKVIVDSCHRPLRVAALAGCRPSERLDPERAAAVLLHARGARREIPARARLAVAINAVDDRSAGPTAELVSVIKKREPAMTVVVIAREADGSVGTLG